MLNIFNYLLSIFSISAKKVQVMGGKNETIIGKAETADKSKEVSFDNNGSTIRIHESSGEVHFHDDANKLKVSIPCHQWFNCWESFLNNDQHKIKIVDVKNKSMLTIDRFEKYMSDSTIVLIKVELKIHSTQFSSDFLSIHKFSTGS